MHLEIKLLPAIEALLARGAALFLTTCNPTTVCDETIARCRAAGAEAHAWRGMSEADLEAGLERVVEFRPTHLCEMGAAITTFLQARKERASVRAALEATGSGTMRLAALQPSYPVFNWDDLPIKEGLHNRRMVGLTACHAFFENTRLTFHGKRVLVVGYGLVGRGVCDAARAYGGRVLVAELDPARALEARFAGEEVVTMDEGLPLADVVITATGAPNVIGAATFAKMRDGSFLMNVGHASEEIELEALRKYPSEQVLPHVERFSIGNRAIHLFAGGSMANLTAGHGDSLNAFDVTLAAMVAAIRFLVTEAPDAPPGVHLLPRHAWIDVARIAAGA
jgi:adenosylhomocysteinase